MKDRGFSLIELIVVLVLLSLSIALIAPSLSRFSKTVELKAAAKKVSAILRYYRSEAINKGKVYQVLFDSNLREVKVQSIESEDQEENGEERGQERSQSLFPSRGGPDERDEVESPQYPSDLPTIEFYPNGGSNGGDILLDTQSQKGFKIKVNFLTGKSSSKRSKRNKSDAKCQNLKIQIE